MFDKGIIQLLETTFQNDGENKGFISSATDGLVVSGLQR
jgi:hypothetical protein